MSAPSAYVCTVPELAPARPPFGFIELREYQRQHRNEWSSFESLRWFTRQNRVELVEAGALGLWKGALVVNPESFEASSKKILVRNALKSLERRSGGRRQRGA